MTQQNPIEKIQGLIHRDKRTSLSGSRAKEGRSAIRPEAMPSPKKAQGKPMRDQNVKAPDTPSHSLTLPPPPPPPEKILVLTNLVARGKPMAKPQRKKHPRRDARSYAPIDQDVPSDRGKSPYPSLAIRSIVRFFLNPFTLIADTLALPYRAWTRARHIDSAFTRTMWRTSVMYESSRHFWRHAPLYAGKNLLRVLLAFPLAPFVLLLRVVLLPYRLAREGRGVSRGARARARRFVVWGGVFLRQPFLLLARALAMVYRMPARGARGLGTAMPSAEWVLRRLRGERGATTASSSRGGGLAKRLAKRLVGGVREAFAKVLAFVKGLGRRLRPGELAVPSMEHTSASTEHTSASTEHIFDSVERSPLPSPAGFSLPPDKKEEARQAAREEGGKEEARQEGRLFREEESDSLLDDFFATPSAPRDEEKQAEQESPQAEKVERREELQEKLVADREKHREKKLVYKGMDEILAAVRKYETPLGAVAAEDSALAKERADGRAEQRAERRRASHHPQTDEEA